MDDHSEPDLKALYAQHRGREVAKLRHYLDIYESHFARFRGTDVHVLEIGVNHGGSLQIWKQYFGPRARIVGLDINPNCKAVEEPGIEVLIGDQGEREFLVGLKDRLPRIDILIDDGGHSMRQQITTFEVLYPHLADRGVYLCEDTCTSYWRRFGGGYRRRGTFIEHAKGMVDQLYAWHSEQVGRLAVSDFTRSCRSISFYDSVVVFEKAQVERMELLIAGEGRVPPHAAPVPGWRGLGRRAEHALKRLLTRR